MRLLTLFILVFSLALPATVQAADLSGIWQRSGQDSGQSSKGHVRIAFAPCAGGICGKIVWLDPATKSKARIGDRIFYDLARNGAKGWKGKAFSPKENKTYTATLVMEGGTLSSKECLFGDQICRSETWIRVN